MSVNTNAYNKIKAELDARQVTLVAVSKTKPAEDIKTLYTLGHRDFGENYVQELADKASQLPIDIRWHFIGHLQTNKVKQLAGFVQLIHGVDSLKLLKEIDKQGKRVNRVMDCLLQVHIAQEETKFGFDETELELAWKEIHNKKMHNLNVRGFMGMASFTDDMNKVRIEFRKLKDLFDRYGSEKKDLNILSMGMSSDYEVALEEGSTMVRIGSRLFGERDR